jgi:NADPH:quinone reductase-like Zn-dependent oxidoreductase
MAIPTTMRALVAPRKCGAEDYEVIELPVPKVTLPTHVLVKVYAAAANTGELQALDGRFGLIYLPK